MSTAYSTKAGRAIQNLKDGRREIRGMPEVKSFKGLIREIGHAISALEVMEDREIELLKRQRS